MYNFAEHPKSIRVVAKKLLSEAIDASSKPPKEACKEHCDGKSSPLVVFKVEPTAYLPKQKQEQMCFKLARDTSNHPLVFTPRDFSTLDKFDAWILQFSQGMGDDGKQLFAQCGGNCDPSYTFVIEPDDGAMKVFPEVYCGLVRDRSNEDMFKLSTALRPDCNQAKR